MWLLGRSTENSPQFSYYMDLLGRNPGILNSVGLIETLSFCGWNWYCDLSKVWQFSIVINTLYDLFSLMTKDQCFLDYSLKQQSLYCFRDVFGPTVRVYKLKIPNCRLILENWWFVISLATLNRECFEFQSVLGTYQARG